jgi:hypothetical protein
MVITIDEKDMSQDDIDIYNNTLIRRLEEDEAYERMIRFSGGRCARGTCD